MRAEILLSQMERIASVFQFRKVLNTNRELFTAAQQKWAEDRLKAYDAAVKEKYQFGTYGDALLII